MCGRYTIFTDADERELFEIIEAAREQYGDGSFKTGEIFPGDTVPVLTVPYFRRPSLLTWGFPMKTGKRLIINARSETAAERPMFRDALPRGAVLYLRRGFTSGMPQSRSIFSLYRAQKSFIWRGFTAFMKARQDL